MDLNKVFILGRLTADPQLRAIPSGQSVVNFGVATNRVWTDKSGQKQKSVEFHNVVVWGRQGEIVSKFLNKGSLILVEGRLQTRSWEDKQGQSRKTTEIIAERIQLGPRLGQQERPINSPVANERESVAEKSSPAEEIPVIEVEEEIKGEDLPF